MRPLSLFSVTKTQRALSPVERRLSDNACRTSTPPGYRIRPNSAAPNRSDRRAADESRQALRHRTTRPEAGKRGKRSEYSGASSPCSHSRSEAPRARNRNRFRTPRETTSPTICDKIGSKKGKAMIYASTYQARSQPELSYPPVPIGHRRPCIVRLAFRHKSPLPGGENFMPENRKHHKLEGRYSKAHNRKTERFARWQASETGTAAPDRRYDPACGRATKTMPHPGNPLAIRNPLRFGQIKRLCK